MISLLNFDKQRIVHRMVLDIYRPTFIWSIQIKFDPQRRETKVEKERKSSEKIEKQEGKGTGSRCIGRNAASVAQGEPLRAAP